jgi:hypothetical protein
MSNIYHNACQSERCIQVLFPVLFLLHKETICWAEEEWHAVDILRGCNEYNEI